jgi:hypothetical protein
MAETHAVLDTPEQHGIPTMGDHMVHLGRRHHDAGTLALSTQRVTA